MPTHDPSPDATPAASAAPAGSALPTGWQQIHIHPHAPAKPPMGAPCNGCGVCCLVVPCPLGMVVSRRRHGACSALAWSEAAQRYHCGLLLAPQRLIGLREPRPRWLAALLGRWVRRWIAAGQGCDASWEPQSSATPQSSHDTERSL